MKKLFCYLICSFLLVSVQAQTKRIAHRSHSGANGTLRYTTIDNFGEYKPYPPVEKKTTTPSVDQKKTVVKGKAKASRIVIPK